MGDLAERKLKLLQAVISVQDEHTVSALEAALLKAKSQEAILQKLAKPIRKKTDLKQTIKDQNWTPVDRNQWDRLIDQLDIQEPVEDLLKMLTK